MSAREAVLEELDAAVSAPSGAAVVSGAPTCSVALLGQPNSGKSTLFNALTGSRQRVGNWPGKTVEKKEGGFSRGGVDYAVCDLPGTYSLSANSEEEVVTRDYIASGRADVDACSRTPRSWNEACTCSPTSRASIAPACSC